MRTGSQRVRWMSVSEWRHLLDNNQLTVLPMSVSVRIHRSELCHSHQVLHPVFMLKWRYLHRIAIDLRIYLSVSAMYQRSKLRTNNQWLRRLSLFEWWHLCSDKYIALLSMQVSLRLHWIHLFDQDLFLHAIFMSERRLVHRIACHVWIKMRMPAMYCWTKLRIES